MEQSNEINESELRDLLGKARELVVPSEAAIDALHNTLAALEQQAQGEALEELKETDRDAAPSEVSAHAADTRPTGVVVASPGSGSGSHSAIFDFIQQLGSRSKAVAAKAANQLLQFRARHLDTFREWLDRTLSTPMCEDSTRRLVWAVHDAQASAKLRAFYYDADFRQVISEASAVAWLSGEVEAHCVVSTSAMRLSVVKVPIPEGERFAAAWIEVEPSVHLLMVADGLPFPRQRDAVDHELEHFCQELIMNMETTDIGEPAAPPRPKERYVSFAGRQLGVDVYEKNLAARWTIHELPLRDGDGIVLDAGTSCWLTWKQILDLVGSEKLAHLMVHTNSHLVQTYWMERTESPQIACLKLELLGTVLDSEHKAYYWRTPKDRVMPRSLRPNTVYIGTSGIEFDEKEGILFGYHEGPREQDMKEFFFECAAKRRIILATPAKIGSAGGQSFDVLSIEKIDARAPIYLVTAEPEPGSDYAEAFERAREAFQSEAIQQAVAEKGLLFRWVTLDRNNGGVPKLKEELVAGKEQKPCLSRAV